MLPLLALQADWGLKIENKHLVKVGIYVVSCCFCVIRSEVEPAQLFTDQAQPSFHTQVVKTSRGVNSIQHAALHRHSSIKD